jgi:hypothetical protein
VRRGVEKEGIRARAKKHRNFSCGEENPPHTATTAMKVCWRKVVCLGIVLKIRSTEEVDLTKIGREGGR